MFRRVLPVDASIVVDVESAVVSYRPAAGEERSTPAAKVSLEALLRASPWRTFRSYSGQMHYPGTYWSSTQRGHVIYESRLELANLLLADYDQGVREISAQPFLLRAAVEGRVRPHIPDYLFSGDGGPVVVDVVRRERMSNPKIRFVCAWTRQVIERMGWTYQVVHEPDPVHLANVRFLAGYRRDWLMNQEILAVLRAQPRAFAGSTIAEAETALAQFPKQFVRPALLNLLWRHEYEVDISGPLRPSSVLEMKK